MKKSVTVLALALGFSFVTLNATNVELNSETIEVFS